MNPLTRDTVEDIEAVARTPWPATALEANDFLHSRFAGRDQPALDEVDVSYDASGSVTSIGWSIFYDSAGQLRREHDTFCEAMASKFGSPIDQSATSVAWRRQGLLIESYSHLATTMDPKSSHQIGISVDPESSSA